MFTDELEHLVGDAGFFRIEKNFKELLFALRDRK